MFGEDEVQECVGEANVEQIYHSCKPLALATKEWDRGESFERD